MSFLHSVIAHFSTPARLLKIRRLYNFTFFVYYEDEINNLKRIAVARVFRVAYPLAGLAVHKGRGCREMIMKERTSEERAVYKWTYARPFMLRANAKDCFNGLVLDR